MADKEGNTPLHLCDSLELMDALFKTNAEPNATNKVTDRFTNNSSFYSFYFIFT